MFQFTLCLEGSLPLGPGAETGALDEAPASRLPTVAHPASSVRSGPGVTGAPGCGWLPSGLAAARVHPSDVIPRQAVALTPREPPRQGEAAEAYPEGPAHRLRRWAAGRTDPPLDPRPGRFGVEPVVSGSLCWRHLELQRRRRVLSRPWGHLFHHAPCAGAGSLVNLSGGTTITTAESWNIPITSDVSLRSVMNHPPASSPWIISFSRNVAHIGF